MAPTPSPGAAQAAPRSTGPAPEARFRRALVIANPIAGCGRAARAAEALLYGLRERGLEAELALTAAAGDARRIAREVEPSVDLVVAVGGDGTLGEVLGGLGDPAVPVAVLPLGTANVLARDFGLPRDAGGLLALIEHGRVVPIDVARVGERTSFLMTSVGFDAMVVHALCATRVGPITKLSYLRPALRTLAAYREPRLTVWLDGERLEGTFGFVLASNCIHYAGVLRLAPDRRLDDGQFEVFLLRRAGIANLFAWTVRGLVGKLPGGACTMRRAAHVRVEAEEPTPCQIDGDVGGATPLELRVDPRPRHLLVPAETHR